MQKIDVGDKVELLADTPDKGVIASVVAVYIFRGKKYYDLEFTDYDGVEVSWPSATAAIIKKVS